MADGLNRQPAWVVLLSRFGFPTATAVVLLGAFLTWAEQDRQASKAERMAFAAALQDLSAATNLNTQATREWARVIDTHGARVDRLADRVERIEALGARAMARRLPAPAPGDR